MTDAGDAAEGRPFGLRARPLLSRATLDRREPLLDDTERQAKLWLEGRLVVVDQTGSVLTANGGTELVYQPSAGYADAPPPGAVLLGERDGTGYWALRVPREGADADRTTWRVWTGPGPEGGEQWLDLRAVGALLDATDAGVLTTAMAVLNWHRIGGFCAKCGSPTTIVRVGWATHCTGCGREEYPRTDPAVICLVHDGVGVNGENMLLARQPSWPEGRYSVLAGFVEAGESLEDCVVREISEEVGLDVSDVRYLGNQPWPFPRSLMIGFSAVADPDVPVRPADGEIEQARWVSRERVREVLEADGGDGGGISGGDGVGGIALPGGISIARQMVESWAYPDPA